MTILTLDESLGRLIPGQRVFVPGASGAPVGWMDRLLSRADFNRGLAITTTYVPGINTLDLSELHPDTTVTGLFMHANLSHAAAEGLYRPLPVSYAGFVRELQQKLRFDVAAVQVSVPDRGGMCSLGPSVEFSLLTLSDAKRRIGVINPEVPRIPGSVVVRADWFTDLAEIDTQIPTYAAGRGSCAVQAISKNVAKYIEDGMTLQIGLGKIPDAILKELGNRRRLKFHSGMLSDGLIALAAQGALAQDFTHTACALVGSQEFYQWTKEFAPLSLRGCDVTHDPSRLGALTRFVAINSALKVDLFGQCDLELLNGKSVSGAGGAPDFAAAAKRSVGGLSIIALPASSRNVSRIRARLGQDGVCTLPRTDVDVVVTEYGSADFRGLSVNERAERLISIATPEARGGLQAAWRKISSRL